MKTSDKIDKIEGINYRTRNNLKSIVQFMFSHHPLQNSDVVALLRLSPNRARIHLMLLVENGILISSGDNKQRVYRLKH